MKSTKFPTIWQMNDSSSINEKLIRNQENEGCEKNKGKQFQTNNNNNNSIFTNPSPSPLHIYTKDTYNYADASPPKACYSPTFHNAQRYPPLSHHPSNSQIPSHHHWTLPPLLSQQFPNENDQKNTNNIYPKTPIYPLHGYENPQRLHQEVTHETFHSEQQQQQNHPLQIQRTSFLPGNHLSSLSIQAPVLDSRGGLHDAMVNPLNNTFQRSDQSTSPMRGTHTMSIGNSYSRLMTSCGFLEPSFQSHSRIPDGEIPQNHLLTCNVQQDQQIPKAQTHANYRKGKMQMQNTLINSESAFAPKNYKTRGTSSLPQTPPLQTVRDTSNTVFVKEKGNAFISHWKMNTGVKMKRRRRTRNEGKKSQDPNKQNEGSKFSHKPSTEFEEDESNGFQGYSSKSFEEPRFDNHSSHGKGVSEVSEKDAGVMDESEETLRSHRKKRKRVSIEDIVHSENIDYQNDVSMELFFDVFNQQNKNNKFQ